MIGSINEASIDGRLVFEELGLEFKSLPAIYRAKGLTDNPDLLRLVHESVLQWPEDTSLDDKTKEFVGMAKSIAHNWEPGVITNIEGAIEAGASERELLEAILVASSVLALADLDFALRSADLTNSPATETNPEIEKILTEAKTRFATVPRSYDTQLARENSGWLRAVHEFAKIRYSEGTLAAKTKALICLAVSVVKHWDDGAREYVQYALRSGATRKEVADVLFSTYKTAGVIGIQMGLGVPCSVPDLPGFRLISDHYRKSSRRR